MTNRVKVRDIQKGDPAMKMVNLDESIGIRVERKKFESTLVQIVTTGMSNKTTSIIAVNIETTRDILTNHDNTKY